ncbi:MULTISPECIES: DUF2147 domain-containing protein [unclassified Undibacterium]|uniref:DUF2147 domain-containing protein n=1 Tax=unclassified Undibacterium TaxID=2630295 RepID=UPI002AC89E90|nr:MULTISPECIES: DUF2147 domain-containing protein [unclassified Undibacterium]MEB0138261.1 DUF2147 domain-containing protein [Undibacterium sp. CCC2.1]MEB0171578.1 DUF2147 domain-containing protein [Undibacterium sp. CCC1.1]MEB0175502.1 DUF2147 domain-containing protein [Undibacterium sp. CCC3.4]MEB0214778.1 DUF2147 domain-containing protein [Undibacterium sp. 5I2]WPX45265.1 DUF2147 domain-containing protein [Undibacterium sp. CCC3.4]
MKTFRSAALPALILPLLLTLATAPAAHAQDSPVGLWKSIDDKSGKPKALIRISDNAGELQGKIEKLFLEPGADSNPKCDKCEGANKDQPIIGMTILFGLKKDGDEYTGGKILDPANGKLYRSKLSFLENATKLNVRGYIGAPLFGRSQIWLREP